VALGDGLGSMSQPMEALAVANRVRSERAEIKRRLRCGEVKLEELDRATVESLASMKVIELLRALPWTRRPVTSGRMTEHRAVRAHALLRGLRIPASATVGAVVERDMWHPLLARLRRDCPSQ